MGDADSSAANGDDCACFDRLPMPLQHLGHQGDTLAHGIQEAHQAGMLEAPDCGWASAECSGHLRHK